MKIPRRRFLRLGASVAALPIISQVAGAENQPSRPELRAGQQPLAQRLAAYAHRLRYEDLDAATIERVKTHLIDTIGCGLCAWDERPVGICREIALSANGPATIIGTLQQATTDMAAFANGAAFRYLDFNDSYVVRFAVHPSDNIAACLAVAEAERASAKGLITAIVVAYEVNCRLADSTDISKRGWDPTVFGLPAVALAAGRLMRLDPDQLTQAVNLAINDHIPLAQTRVGELSDWKGLSVAEPGRNAVFRRAPGTRWPDGAGAHIRGKLRRLPAGDGLGERRR
jgi:2-methylcitrate dehydratase